MNYKKVFRSQKLRFFILKFLSFLPDKLMLSLQYWIKLNRKLNWKNPQRFTEFIQLYKVKYRNPILHKLVDKYAVREYVKNIGLENILTKNYGNYPDANQIDFSRLPEKFVLKTTNGSGGENIIICKDKSKLDVSRTQINLNGWLKQKTIDAGREWAYTGISNPRIIIEELLINPTSPDDGIEDYKILCFKGEPKIVILDCDRYVGHKRNFYDTDWNRIYVTSDCPEKNAQIPKPDNLLEMLSIASKLSEGLPFVRVDLYNIEGKIYFGELTLYPWSGYVQFNPDNFDFFLGDFFKKSHFLKNIQNDKN